MHHYGLFDCHVNGALGFDLNDPLATSQVEKIRSFLNYQYSHGIAMIGATFVSNSNENIYLGLEHLIKARDADRLIKFSIPLVHFEIYAAKEAGPRGAHKPEYFREPVWSTFRSFLDLVQENGLKVWVTIDPSLLAPDDDFIHKCVSRGVVVGIGHTDAYGEPIDKAIREGATLSTHLWNGTSKVQDRSCNAIIDQLAQRELTACLILDGHHVPKKAAMVTYRCKGPENTILVSDSTSLAGMPPGPYQFNDQDVKLEENGRISLASDPRYMAGSSANLAKCLECAKDYGIPPGTALNMANIYPARIFGMEKELRKTKLSYNWNLEKNHITVKQLKIGDEIVYKA